MLSTAVQTSPLTFTSADMLQSFSYVCRMFYFGSSHLFQHDFCENEPNATENETDVFVETNVETSDADSAEFLSCGEGLDDVFEDVFEDFSEENLFLNGVEATVCQENHGTSGHMDWEYHVRRQVQVKLSGNAVTGRLWTRVSG